MPDEVFAIDEDFVFGAGGAPSEKLACETLVFEFAGAATQEFRPGRAGWLVGFHTNVTVCGISLGPALPTSLPNGSQTRIHRGYVWADGAGSTIGSKLGMFKFKFDERAVLSVKATAVCVISVILAYDVV